MIAQMTIGDGIAAAAAMIAGAGFLCFVVWILAGAPGTSRKK